VLTAAIERFGSTLGDVIATSAIWVNGEQADEGQAIDATDEVAVLPPVSGG
jgi:molybdopterin converting factor small subunit